MDREYIKLYKKSLLKYKELRGGNNYNNKQSIQVFYNFKDEDYDKFIKENIDIEKYLEEMLRKYGKRDPTLNVNFKKAFPFYYVYLLQVEFEGKYNNNDGVEIKNGHVEKVTLIKGKLYVHFFPFGASKNVKLFFPTSIKIKSMAIHEISYKNGDSFIIGKTKPLKHIYHIIEQQRLSREQYPNNISNMRLNEITAAKLDYHEFLVDNSIIPEDTTKTIRNYEDGKYKTDEFKDNVLKYPFHSASSCVFLPGNKFGKVLSECYVDFGYIKQEYNPTLGEYELKCHVINGEIEFILVRVKLGNYICIDKNFSTVDPNLKEFFDEYSEKIKDVCEKTFKLMNKLRLIKDERAKTEMDAFNKMFDKLSSEQKQIVMKPLVEKYNGKTYETNYESIFTSLLTNLKMKKLNMIDTDIKEKDELIELIKLSDTEFNDKYTKIGDDYPIKDYYMRIDIALPDGENYKEPYVNEVEPFASGKSDTYTYKKFNCVDDLKGSPTSIILRKIFISSINKGYLEFEDVEYK